MDRLSETVTGRPGVAGVDEAFGNRPGVPMEVEPQAFEGAHWDTPEQQHKRRAHLRRKGLKRMTPVFGTAQPPRGVSGIMRRIAYRIPEHRARHWALLLAADRVDVVEDRIGGFLAGPLRGGRLEPLGRQIQYNPMRTIGIALLAGIVVQRMLR